LVLQEISRNSICSIRFKEWCFISNEFSSRERDHYM